jgi:hypothetical protein
MSFPLPQSWSGATQPFRIVQQQADATSAGYFRPEAAVHVTAALRTLGLLRGIPAEEIKTLLLLLTYLTPNGAFMATVPQMAEAMRVSEGKVEQRLRRLQEFVWQGEPLLREQVRESGLRSYTPSAFLVGIEQLPSVKSTSAPGQHQTSREAVIAHSRAAYAHPRAEVERLIAEQNGWDIPGEVASHESSSDLYRRLLRFGILPEQAAELLEQHPTAEIRQQLDWLPYRNVRKPAPFLIAAIENCYAEPIAARQRRLFDQAVQTPQEAPNAADGPPQLETVPASAIHLTEGETLALPAVPPDAGRQNKA